MKITRRLLPGVLVLLLVGCAGEPSPTPPPSAEVLTVVPLDRAPPGMACDAIGVSYRSATFQIDAAGAQPVMARTETGQPLRTVWTPGFERGPDGEATVVDPAGAVVAADGDTLAIPTDAWPRVHDYLVCPTPDALYVLLTEPS